MAETLGGYELNKVYCEDCLVALKKLPDRCVDLVLTDPPYGIDYDTNYERFYRKGVRTGKKWPAVHGDKQPFDPSPFLRLSNNFIFWGANCYSQRLPLGSWLVWDKRFSNGEAFLSDAEVAWMNKGFGVYIFSETSQGCTFPDGKRVHPTQKPVSLMKWCLQKFPSAKTILDPYAGSGSCLVAAKELGRKFLGFEISPAYTKICEQRLAQEILL